MGMFVHLVSEDFTKRVQRTGIRGRTVWTIGAAHDRLGVRDAVYCMPVTPNFVATHQWVRELKRLGKRTISGVYFRLPGATQVWAGRYNEPHDLVTASTAAARLMRSENSEGFEVILPRSVAASEIHAIRSLPQTIGWRYFPGSHDRGIFCRCESCNKGGIKARRVILDEESRNRLSREIAVGIREADAMMTVSGPEFMREWKRAERRREVRKSRRK